MSRYGGSGGAGRGLNGFSGAKRPSRFERGLGTTGRTDIDDSGTILPPSGFARGRESNVTNRTRYGSGFLSTDLLQFLAADVETLISIDSISVCNVSANNATFSLQHIPRGSSTGTEFSIFEQVEVKKRSSILISDFPIYLTSGDALFAKASAASAITMTMYARRGA